MANDRQISILVKAQDEASKVLKDVGENAEKSGRGLEIARKGLVAIGVAAAAAAAATAAFLKSAIDKAVEAEAEQARLTHILQTATGASNEQVEALFRQADAMEKVGVVSAGAVIQAQAQLATFDLQAESIESLIPAILDYAVAEKGAGASTEDLKQLTNGLAQALQGNFGSLTRTGFVLDEATKSMISNGTEAEKVAAIVSVLDSTYAGFNEMAAQTAEGSLVRMKNGLDSLKTTIGADLLPVFTDMIGRISDNMAALEGWYKSMGGLEGIKNSFVSSFQEMMSNIDQKTGLITHLKSTWETLSTFFIENVKPAFERLMEAIKPFMPALEFLAKLVGAVLVGAFHIAIAVIRTALLAAFTVITAAVNILSGTLEFLAKAWDWIIDKFKIVIDWGQKVVDTFNRIIKAAREAMEFVGGGISGAFNSVKSTVGNIGSALGFAEGGIVTRPTLAMIGEAGESEAVIPLSKLPSLMGAGAGGATININGGYYLSEDAARDMADKLMDILKLNRKL
jgi:hypothetical protein